MPKASPTPAKMGRPVTTYATERRRNGELRPITAWVEHDLWRALRVYAVQHDVRMSDLVSGAVEKYLRALLKDEGAT